MEPKCLIENALMDPHSPMVPVVRKLVVDLDPFEPPNPLRGQRRTEPAYIEVHHPTLS